MNLSEISLILHGIFWIKLKPNLMIMKSSPEWIFYTVMYMYQTLGLIYYSFLHKTMCVLHKIKKQSLIMQYNSNYKRGSLSY